jgi:hypothetical protein
LYNINNNKRKSGNKFNELADKKLLSVDLIQKNKKKIIKKMNNIILTDANKGKRICQEKAVRNIFTQVKQL